MGQVWEVLGHRVFTTPTPTHQPALDAAANDAAHGDDTFGKVEEKFSKLPTA